VSVSGNWRLTYAFENGDAILVDYEDYQEEGTDNEQDVRAGPTL
jgi:hypothetical protein